jgi:ABC-2 type transport system ATP-binding protein
MLLDEPLASMDPLARRNFLRVLLGETAELGLTVLLSSHIIGDLERVCDYLIILSDAHVQLAGDIDEIIRTHKRLVGPRTLAAAVARIHEVIEERHGERQTTLLVRINGHLFDQSWEMHDVTLEEIVLAYMGQLAQYQRMEKLPLPMSMRDGIACEESEERIRRETPR